MDLRLAPRHKTHYAHDVVENRSGNKISKKGTPRTHTTPLDNGMRSRRRYLDSQTQVASAGPSISSMSSSDWHMLLEEDVVVVVEDEVLDPVATRAHLYWIRPKCQHEYPGHHEEQKGGVMGLYYDMQPGRIRRAKSSTHSRGGCCTFRVPAQYRAGFGLQTHQRDNKRRQDLLVMQQSTVPLVCHRQISLTTRGIWNKSVLATTHWKATAHIEVLRAVSDTLGAYFRAVQTIHIHADIHYLALSVNGLCLPTYCIIYSF